MPYFIDVMSFDVSNGLSGYEHMPTPYETAEAAREHAQRILSNPDNNFGSNTFRIVDEEGQEI